MSLQRRARGERRLLPLLTLRRSLVSSPFSHRLAVKDMSVPRPLLRRRDFCQQFAGALADQGGFVIRDAIATQQRALDFLIDADQIANFFSYIVHVEPPSVVQISMNATSGQIITELLPSRAQEGTNQQSIGEVVPRLVEDPRGLPR